MSTFEGKKIELTLRKSNSTRSLQANAYYWGVVVKLIADHCGYDSAELHEALKYKFLSNHEADETGLVRIKSTASLTVDEFIRYTNDVVIWAARDLQVYIPAPGDVDIGR
jgi:hypothetical protein